jgi:aryl-alcohol dehydrogenase-like predicted oxidoreductase
MRGMTLPPPAPGDSRRVGPFDVAPIGLGCMNLHWAYGPAVDDAQAERVLLTALDAGVTLFDTAALYGFGLNETVVGRCLKPHRDRIVLCSKGGMAGEPVGPGGALQRVIDGRPATLRRHVEASLRRLQTDRIDLYYLHRLDRAVPIEDSVGELARLVREGKLRALGLSEVSATTLRRAVCEAPIAAVQSEYSLWTRNPEIAVLQACRELGVALIAFSPLGRGFLTDTPPPSDGLALGDIRLSMPRFAPGNRPANDALHRPFVQLAAEAGCTPAQLALAWLLHRGPQVTAIPGTTRVEHLHENQRSAQVVLSASMIERLDWLWAPGRVRGGRYNEATQREVDTEEFV